MKCIFLKAMPKKWHDNFENTDKTLENSTLQDICCYIMKQLAKDLYVDPKDNKGKGKQNGKGNKPQSNVNNNNSRYNHNNRNKCGKNSNGKHNSNQNRGNN